MPRCTTSRYREDPAIRKLAVEGLASQKHEDGGGGSAEAQAFDPSAMSFRKLEAYFTKSGNLVEVRDGSMFGPTLGATVGGTIDFSRDQVNLSGTFVPLFGCQQPVLAAARPGPAPRRGPPRGAAGPQLSHHRLGREPGAQREPAVGPGAGLPAPDLRRLRRLRQNGAKALDPLHLGQD